MRGYEHCYVIIRIDDRASHHPFDLDTDVTFKSVELTKEKADSEVERLNKLNADKGCKYLWKLSRIEKK